MQAKHCTAVVAGSLRLLAADLASDLWQIKAGRGDPLCRLSARHLRTLPTGGRIELDSTIVERAISYNNLKKALRGQRRRRQTLAAIRNLPQTTEMNNVDPFA
nr:hypothetical protein [Bradyrhizobium shewense]